MQNRPTSRIGSVGIVGERKWKLFVLVVSMLILFISFHEDSQQINDSFVFTIFHLLSLSLSLFFFFNTIAIGANSGSFV